LIISFAIVISIVALQFASGEWTWPYEWAWEHEQTRSVPIKQQSVNIEPATTLVDIVCQSEYWIVKCSLHQIAGSEPALVVWDIDIHCDCAVVLHAAASKISTPHRAVIAVTGERLSKLHALRQSVVGRPVNH